MDSTRRDVVFVDAMLPNGASVKVAALRTGNAQDVGLLKVFNFARIQDVLSGVTEMVRNAVSKVAPDNVEIEFAVAMSVESGELLALLTDAGGEASLTVRVGWDRNTTSLPSAVGSTPAA